MNQLQIIQEYTQGINLKLLAKKCKKRTSYIRQILKNGGIPLRTMSQATRRYKFNEDFFEVINTEEKAYWLGFLAADGCIYKHPTRSVFQLRLTLSKKDLGHLLLFKDTIQSKHSLYTRVQCRGENKTTSVGIAISSPKLFNDLMDKGITPRKSLTLSPPTDVPKSLIHHWIRGYFDGDGSASIKRQIYTIVTITGTNKILKFILENSKVEARIFLRPTSKAFHCSIGRQKEVKIFKTYIYKDATVYLQRKFNRFL